MERVTFDQIGRTSKLEIITILSSMGVFMNGYALSILSTTYEVITGAMISAPFSYILDPGNNFLQALFIFYFSTWFLIFAVIFEVLYFKRKPGKKSDARCLTGRASAIYSVVFFVLLDTEFLT